MISILTGTPGSGKTLFLMAELLNALNSGRPVFVSGVPELAPEIAAQVGQLPDDTLAGWESLPDNSIVFVDESQRLIPFLGFKGPPPYIEAFTRHRHRGFDFWFITQHPKLIDSTVRRLCGQHVHLHRTFNGNGGTKFVWEWSQDDPYNWSSKKMAVKSLYRHDKKLFGLYKSATTHTHKFRLPLIIPLLGLVAIAAVSGLWWNLSGSAGWMNAADTNPSFSGSQASASSFPSQAVGTGGQAMPPAGPPPPLGIPGLADGFVVHHAASGPLRLLCIASDASCSCFTVQVTRYPLDLSVCRIYSTFGVAEPFRFVPSVKGKS